MLEIITWIIVGFSIIAGFYNARKSIISYFIWPFTNASLMIINVIQHQYAQALLWFIYLVLVVYGIYNWRKLENKN